MLAQRMPVHYRVQLLDGCHNCKFKTMMFSEPGRVPIPACSLGGPSGDTCEEVDPLGICDAHEKGEPK